MAVATARLDADTLAMLRSIFHEACDCLPPHRRTSTIRSDLAIPLLNRALQDGQDAAELRAYALNEVAALSNGPKQGV